MEARVTAAGQGWQWIVDGFAMFRKIPLMWIALSFVLVLLWMVSFVIPVIGPLLFNLLSPVLFAGLMLGCKAVEAGEDLEISHLFAGFQKHAVPLVTVGGVYLVGTIIIVGIVLATAGGSMLPTVLSKSQTDLQTLSAMLRSMVLALSVAMAFYIPLIMLIWFAPVLVVLHNLAPVAAMKLSFRACWINMMPFLVYGLAAMVLWLIASIPLLLGLVVLVPVLICSVYASYRDIFNLPDEKKSGELNRPLSQEIPLSSQKMVRCEVCDTFIPANEVLTDRGNNFCCEEHRQQFFKKN